MCFFLINAVSDMNNRLKILPLPIVILDSLITDRYSGFSRCIFLTCVWILCSNPARFFVDLIVRDGLMEDYCTRISQRLLCNRHGKKRDIRCYIVTVIRNIRCYMVTVKRNMCYMVIIKRNIRCYMVSGTCVTQWYSVLQRWQAVLSGTSVCFLLY